MALDGRSAEEMVKQLQSGDLTKDMFSMNLGIYISFLKPLVPLLWTSGDVFLPVLLPVACMFHHLHKVDSSDSHLSATSANLLDANIVTELITHILSAFNKPYRLSARYFFMTVGIALLIGVEFCLHFLRLLDFHCDILQLVISVKGSNRTKRESILQKSHQAKFIATSFFPLTLKCAGISIKIKKS